MNSTLASCLSVKIWQKRSHSRLDRLLTLHTSEYIFSHIINTVFRQIELYLLKCYVFPSETKKMLSSSCITQYVVKVC